MKTPIIVNIDAFYCTPGHHAGNSEKYDSFSLEVRSYSDQYWNIKSTRSSSWKHSELIIYSRDLLFGSLAWWVLTTFAILYNATGYFHTLFQRYNLFSWRSIQLFYSIAWTLILGNRNRCAWLQQFGNIVVHCGRTTDTVLESASLPS